MNSCECGAVLPNHYLICPECKLAHYEALAQPVDSEWGFDDEAFVRFLDEGE